MDMRLQAMAVVCNSKSETTFVSFVSCRPRFLSAGASDDD